MHQNKRIIMWLRSEYGEGNENVKTVIEALEKQIPKKPTEEEPTDKLWGNHWSCPVCGWNVGVDDLKQDYCSKCGQALDWSEKITEFQKNSEKEGGLNE